MHVLFRDLKVIAISPAFEPGDWPALADLEFEFPAAVRAAVVFAVGLSCTPRYLFVELFDVDEPNPDVESIGAMVLYDLASAGGDGFSWDLSFHTADPIRHAQPLERSAVRPTPAGRFAEWVGRPAFVTPEGVLEVRGRSDWTLEHVDADCLWLRHDSLGWLQIVPDPFIQSLSQSEPSGEPSAPPPTKRPPPPDQAPPSQGSTLRGSVPDEGTDFARAMNNPAAAAAAAAVAEQAPGPPDLVSALGLQPEAAEQWALLTRWDDLAAVLPGATPAFVEIGAVVLSCRERIVGFSDELFSVAPGTHPTEDPIWEEMLPPILTWQALCPRMLEPRVAMAGALRARGDIREAVALHEELLADFPKEGRLRTDLALLFGLLGEPDEALRHLRDEVALGTANFSTWWALAVATSEILGARLADDPEAAFADSSTAELIDEALRACEKAVALGDRGARAEVRELQKKLEMFRPASASERARAAERPAPQHPAGLRGALPVNGEATHCGRIGDLPEVEVPDWPPEEALNGVEFARLWVDRKRTLKLHGEALAGQEFWCPWPVRSWGLGHIEIREGGLFLGLFLYPTPTPTSQGDSVAQLSLRFPDASRPSPPAESWVDALRDEELSPAARQMVKPDPRLDPPDPRPDPRPDPPEPFYPRTQAAPAAPSTPAAQRPRPPLVLVAALTAVVVFGVGVAIMGQLRGPDAPGLDSAEGALPGASASAAEDPARAWVIASRANVRAKPTRSADKVTALEIATEVSISERTADWCSIDAPAVGWIACSLLSDTQPTEESSRGAAIASLRGGSWEATVSAFERAAALDPTDASLQAGLALARCAAGDGEGAGGVLVGLKRADPELAGRVIRRVRACPGPTVADFEELDVR